MCPTRHQNTATPASAQAHPASGSQANKAIGSHEVGSTDAVALSKAVEFALASFNRREPLS